MRIAALAFGDSGEPQWGLPSRTVDFYDAKADLEVLVGVNGPIGAFASDALTFKPLTFEPLNSAALTSESLGGVSAESIGTALHPGRSARVYLHGHPVGWIGELHPRLTSSLDLSRAPIVFELDVEPLLAVSVVKPHEPSKFPQVVRDLALVVGRDCSAQSLLSQLREAIEAVASGLLQSCWPFDEYRGKGLENNEKSLAFRFVFQDNSRTLNDEEIERALRDAIAAAAQHCGARLRG
jgi:phenylalanyl-tRNA synthetase beta chain